MTFSVTFTANSLSELRSLLDKFEGNATAPGEVLSEKPAGKRGRPATIKDVAENVKEEVQKTPSFIGKKKKEEDKPEGLTYNDVKKFTVTLATQNADKVREILSEFGALKATTLTEDQWPEYVEKVKEALEEGKDLA